MINKEDVKIIDIKQIGNYAIRIIFSDGHKTGIYTWEKLLDFALNQDALMRDYRIKLKDHLQF